MHTRRAGEPVCGRRPPKLAADSTRARSVGGDYPMEVFFDLMRPFSTEELKDLKWIDKGNVHKKLKPTRETKTSHRA